MKLLAAIMILSSLALGQTTVKVQDGGTGLRTYTQGDMLYYNSGTALSKLAKYTLRRAYISNHGTSNNPLYEPIDLTLGVTGFLPDSNISSAATWNAKLSSSDTVSIRNYSNFLYQLKGTYLIPSDSTSLRNYSNSLYLKNADSTTERTYSNSLYQAKGTYLIPSDSTTSRTYSNSLYLKNADSTTERTYSNSLYLKNADSTLIRNYSNSIYAPKASPTFTGTITTPLGAGTVRSSSGGVLSSTASDTVGLGAALFGKQATGNYITALTGNVTASGPGSAVATIANLAVTNAMIANTTIDLTAKVTGLLPVANAGLGNVNWTNKSIPYYNGTIFTEDNNNLQYSVSDTTLRVNRIYVDNTTAYIDRSALITANRNDSTLHSGVIWSTVHILEKARGDSGATFSGNAGIYLQTYEDTTKSGLTRRKRGVLYGLIVDLKPITENTPYTANMDVTNIVLDNKGRAQGTEAIYIGGSNFIPHTAANPNGQTFTHGITMTDTLGTGLFVAGPTVAAVDVSSSGGLGSDPLAFLGANTQTMQIGTIRGGLASGNNLTLTSTSHATKGFIYGGTVVNGRFSFDQMNDRVGIGIDAPTQTLQVQGNNTDNKILMTTAANNQSVWLDLQAKDAGGSTVEGTIRASRGGGVDIGSITAHDVNFYRGNSIGMILGASGLSLTNPLIVGSGGTGVATFATNGVLYGNAASAILVTAQGAANSILTANAGAPSFSASPVIGTSVTVPIVYGSSASGGTLTLSSTSHATKARIFFGSSAYDEVNNRLGITASVPAYTLSLGSGTANTKFALYDDGTNVYGMGVQGNDWRIGLPNTSANLNVYDAPAGNLLMRVKGGGGLNVGTTGTLNYVSLDGQAAHSIGMERHTTSNTAGNALTVQSGGATSAATDKAGGDLIALPGVSTGTGRSLIRLQNFFPATATGTADNTSVDREIIGAFKALTNNSVIALVNCTLASNTVIGLHITYTVEVTNGTDLQVETGRVAFMEINKGGVFSNNTALKYGNQQAASSGTLTCTFTITGANPAVISLNANSSLTPSAGYPRITYTIQNNTQQAVAIQ